MMYSALKIIHPLFAVKMFTKTFYLKLFILQVLKDVEDIAVQFYYTVFKF